MKSVIDIAPEMLVEVLAALAMFGVRPTGSRQATSVVSLEIEGYAVPDLPKVTCEITKVEGAHTVTLTGRFLKEGDL